jgi:arylsulfatase A-like enzyme
MLDNMDENIGRLVEHLKQEGLYENTLIIFMNDNGAATNNGADNG